MRDNVHTTGVYPGYPKGGSFALSAHDWKILSMGILLELVFVLFMAILVVWTRLLTVEV